MTFDVLGHAISEIEANVRREVTQKDIDGSPIWLFEPSAVEEIHAFIDDIPQEEREGFRVSIKTPTIIRVVIPLRTRMKNFVSLFTRREDGLGRPWASYNYNEIVEDRRENPETRNRLRLSAIDCVQVRCLFANRYIEKLTKHQERLLRRGGYLEPSGRTIITIRWDAPTPTYVEALDIVTRPAGMTTDRHVCQHEVKGHPRHLRSGKVVWVSAHRRGDPDVPRKTITRIVGHETHSGD